MPAAEPVLIAALSGRALAVSARAAGFAPIVLDAFADLDTRAVAEAWARVPVDHRWWLRRAPLLAAARRLAPSPIPLVWGSGFERAPDLLAELAAGRPIWGMHPATMRAAKDPFAFAAVAARLGIAHPPTRTMPPRHARGWLRKQAGAAGGGHVRPAAGRPPRGRGWYWQRRAPGTAVSALVVGDGTAARVLGFSEQWTAPGSRSRFAGVAAPALLPAAAAAALADAATRIAQAHRLRGIASVDALLSGERLTLLELNPRPGASLDAYERALGLNLFRLHREAVLGRLPEPVLAVGAAATAIVAAPAGLQVPPQFSWPDWTADRTPGGTRVPAGTPLCTVVAAGADLAQVRAAVAVAEARILRLLGLRPAARRRSSAGWPSRDAAGATARPGIGR